MRGAVIYGHRQSKKKTPTLERSQNPSPISSPLSSSFSFFLSLFPILSAPPYAILPPSPHSFFHLVRTRGASQQHSIPTSAPPAPPSAPHSTTPRAAPRAANPWRPLPLPPLLPAHFTSPKAAKLGFYTVMSGRSNKRHHVSLTE